MRRALLTFIVLLLFAGLVTGREVSYGGLKFHDVSTEEELNSLISAHEGEYFFIFYHSESCPACSYMKESVFPTEKAKQALKSLNLVAVDVYRGREITTLRYRVEDKVIVLQPDNFGYYTPKKPGEEISVGVPGTPTMVIFKVVNGTKVLKGVAVGALNPDGLEFFVKTAIGDDLQSPTESTGTQSEMAEKGASEENLNTNLSLAVLLPIFSAGIVSVFSPCVLPIIVGTLSLTFAKRSVEAIVTGMVASFALLGALVGSLGEYASRIQGALYLIGGAGFIVVGLSFISEDVRTGLERILSFSLSDRVLKKSGLIYDFALGSALGATWLGCIAPYVGFAVLTAALSGDILSGVVVMGTYGLGMGLTVYLLTSSKDLAEWVNRKFLSNKLSLGASRSAKWEVTLGVVLIVLGILMLTEITPLKLWSALFESLSKL
ncbi:cytochrome C biogenesis protein [Pyrococcus furiosus DSM 3638]|uniref:Cytochrome C biogenesis protein n=3 Tax=Pyrococcus furiosus TaxID=2261 RepID=A0A5C0XN98_PYRFU|nr:cytochrome c biogenesis protein CcdA [Pyrococcus furiosus]AAL80829.1 cytochrome c-type biogenesis protein [Pyrococcus furiosus DSM 3638]AFN03496.1 cytochrome c-type biogenesis protein [Pyrococcus furiosus COM1]QEK78397.1 cytochrome C biogenesis protein [Pyrococcus furiosus DSM 3638]